MRLWCSGNQTNRYVVCCSQRNYCNDLDAYSKDIRRVLTTPSPTVIPPRRNPPGSSLTLIMIIVITAIAALLLFSGFLFIYMKQKRFMKNKERYPKPNSYPDEQNKISIIQRLFKCFHKRGSLASSTEGRIDQSLTSLLVDLSTGTMGPGKNRF
jgi:hypothetical protein